jgi:hypothetical protein
MGEDPCSGLRWSRAGKKPRNRKRGAKPARVALRWINAAPGLSLIDQGGSRVRDARAYVGGSAPSRPSAVRISSGACTTASPLPRPSAICPVENR